MNRNSNRVGASPIVVGLFAVVTAGLDPSCGGRANDATAAVSGGAQSTIADATPSGDSSPTGGVTATSRSTTEVLANAGASSVSTSANDTMGGAAGAASSGGACVGVTVLPELDYAACNGMAIEVDPMPVDLIILLDRSAASDAVMLGGSTTRWDGIVAGLRILVSSPEAADVGASLTLFGRSAAEDASNCSATTYAVPDVRLGVIAQNGPQILEALAQDPPGGNSPLLAALTGTLGYAISEQFVDRSREKAVVLIFGGIPSNCDGDARVDLVNTIQSAGEGPNSIRTFIVRLQGPAGPSGVAPLLTRSAIAGGTTAPIVIQDSADGPAYAAGLAAALLQIAHAPTQCSYQLLSPSPDWVVDPDRIDLMYQPPGGEARELPRLGTRDSCDRSSNGGWYFDDPVNPTKITLCPCSCAQVGSRPLQLVFGCGHPLEFY